jgi:trehalose 6-phosphate synthase
LPSATSSSKPSILTQLATFPIGIDVDDFSARAIKAVGRPEVVRLRESLQGAKLLLGVDRLDYSKGLVNRPCAGFFSCN